MKALKISVIVTVVFAIIAGVVLLVKNLSGCDCGADCDCDD